VSNIIGDTGGVRMTGGGFGGCVVSLLPHHLVDTVTQAISDQYTAHTQLIANTYICNAGNGAGRIDS
jgi:galactokinase